MEFVECETYEETIKGSEIIISAVSKANDNFCSDECFEEGCTVIPVMTMGFQNCDLFFDQVFTDQIEQIKNFKYFSYFHSVNNTSDVLNGKVQGRVSDGERILVYNYGLAIHDLYFADKFLQLTEEGWGNEIAYRYRKEKYFM